MDGLLLLGGWLVGWTETGVTARDIPLPVKTDKVQVVSYIDILTGAARAGRKVAVIGGKILNSAMQP
jgi:hypothetical protein